MSPDTMPSTLPNPVPPQGFHAQAPAKSDYRANDGKPVLLGAGWARFPLRVDLVREGDDVAAIAARAVVRFFEGLPGAPAAAAALAGQGRWRLYVSEKAVAVAQGRVYRTADVAAGRWARLLCRFVTRTPCGIGLGHPATMQLAIREAGLPRILLATAAAVLGRLVRRRGWFYTVAGPAVRAIDGPTEYSAYPANVSAKLAPADPDGVARLLSAVVRVVLPAAVTTRFGGTVVIDANDLGRTVLGHDTGRPEVELVAAFADNPLGQARQQTPFAVVVEWDPAALGL